jgi:hypothetical protein
MHRMQHIVICYVQSDTERGLPAGYCHNTTEETITLMDNYIYVSPEVTFLSYEAPLLFATHLTGKRTGQNEY